MRQRCSHALRLAYAVAFARGRERVARRRDRGSPARRWRSSRSAGRSSASGRASADRSWKCSGSSSLGIMPPEKKCRLIQSSGAAILERVRHRAVTEDVHEEAAAGREPASRRAQQQRVVAHVLEHLDRHDAVEALARSRTSFMSRVITLDVVQSRARAASARMYSRCECEFETRDDAGSRNSAAPSTA